MAYKACELAYDQCEAWLEERLVHIKDCADSIGAYCAEYLPKVKVTPLEGTYLLWMDFSAYGLSEAPKKALMDGMARIKNALEKYQ